MDLLRVDEFRRVIPKHNAMLVDAKLFISDELVTEDTAFEQLCDAASLKSVAYALGMPDIHQGYGVPIGSVVGLKDVIVPAAVGYDINCGMRIILTPFDYKEVQPHLRELAHSIHRDVPLGEGKTNVTLNREKFAAVLEGGVKAYLEIRTDNQRLEDSRRREDEYEDLNKIEENGTMKGDVRAVSNKAFDRGHKQLGTLGGGNHFVEIQRVERIYDEKLAERFSLRKDQVTIMVHTGSRGFGHQVGDDYMREAKRLNAARSPNAHLCFLDVEAEEGRNYIGAMFAAANFAFVNRQIVTAFVRAAVRHIFGADVHLPILYDVPHNMAKKESRFNEPLWVHRKGATRAFPASRMQGTPYADVGQPVLIPGSMGTASYVLIGTEESRESLYSVNHGAGRVMSRSAAIGRYRKSGKKHRKEAQITDEEFDEAMKGIVLVCEDKRSIKEEAPMAYKDIDEVIKVVVGAGLAKPVARMVPLAVLKG